MARQSAAVALALLGLTLGCKRTPAPAPPAEASAAAGKASATPVDVFSVDHSGLKLGGPIPRADGGVAMQRADRYAELPFGHALLRRDGIIVHLSDAPLGCRDWPRSPHLSITFHLSAGPDGSFYAGRVVTTHVEYVARGFGHVRVEPFEPAPGKHLRGRIGYSDAGSGAHNGPVIEPSRGAGTFDVVICPADEADAGMVRPPPDLAPQAPLAFRGGGGATPSTPGTVLVMVEYDEGDAEPWVSRVEAFEQAGIDCSDPYPKGGADMKVYFGLEAADLGSPQPARFEPDVATKVGEVSRESFAAWVRLEPFDMSAARAVPGTLVAFAAAYDTYPGATTPVHLPPTSLAGRFEGRVCRYGSKFGKPYL